jgi:GT2 family glycosyltransferase
VLVIRARTQLLRAAVLAYKGLLLLFTEGPLALRRRFSEWRQRVPAEVAVEASALPRSLFATEVQFDRPRQTAPPDVSVVIVAWNALKELSACLQSVIENRGRRPLEVVVVDNGSRTDLLEWLTEYGEHHDMIRAVRLAENSGFAHGINVGVTFSRGRSLILLNSDTVVTPGWVDALVDSLDRDVSIGIVSPVTNYVGEGPQLDPAAESVTPATAAVYAASIAKRPVVRIPERLTFFCVAVRRELFELLNGLDEGFGAGNFEDDDFCARSEVLGYDLAVARGVFVYHQGSATFKDNLVDHSAWMTRNAARRLDKLARLSTLPASAPAAARRRLTSDVAVSVVVRTKNRPDTLRLALNSLANQTFRGFEVVLVNSGEPVDDVLGAVDDHLRLEYVSPPEPLTLGEALNAALGQARGEFIAYLDDDDIVYPFHLASLMEKVPARRSEEAFVYSHFSWAFVAGLGSNVPRMVARHRTPPWRYDRDDLLIQNKPALNTWLHSRSVADRLGGFDPRMRVLEDWDFLLRATRELGLRSVPRETCEYRVSLDFTSAMSRRPIALEAMSEIYARHPANSQRVKLERQHQLAAMETQATLLERAKHQRDMGHVTAEATVRDCIRIQFGIELPADVVRAADLERERLVEAAAT